MILMNISGNVTGNAVVKNVNGTIVIGFSVASNRRYKTRNDEVKEETTFMYCELWGKSEEVAKLFFKGRSVNVNGFYRQRKFVGNDGVMKDFISCRVSTFQVFGKNPASSQQTAATTPAAAVSTTTEFNDVPPAEVIDDLPF